MLTNFIEKILEIETTFISYITHLLTGRIKKVRIMQQEIELTTTKNNIYYLIYFLTMSPMSRYKQLSDIVVTDTLGKRYRFAITYVLLSHQYNSRILVSTKTDEVTSLISVTNIHNSAN